MGNGSAACQFVSFISRNFQGNEPNFKLSFSDEGHSFRHRNLSGCDAVYFFANTTGDTSTPRMRPKKSRTTGYNTAGIVADLTSN